MIKKTDLDKIDNSKMYKVYDSWPEIAEENFNLGNSQEMKIPKHIIFSGMGGSGAINDIFASIFSKTNVHVEVIKGYLLPKTVSKETIVIVTSVSGNTTETLNILYLAKKINCKILVFSSGGRMEEYCKRESITFIKIPMYNSPRASFVAYLFRMVKELKKILPLEENEINASIKELRRIRNNISSGNLTDSNKAIKFAHGINTIPVIYYPFGLQAVAIRFKNSLQENSKIHATAEDIIEASHNGIVAWNDSKTVFPILIQGEDDFIKTKERWKIVKKLFLKNNITYLQIKSVKGGIFTKLIQLVYFLDYVSIYLAIIKKIDPTPVESIDFIKSNLTNSL